MRADDKYYLIIEINEEEDTRNFIGVCDTLTKARDIIDFLEDEAINSEFTYKCEIINFYSG
jgi:hypothetical protein